MGRPNTVSKRIAKPGTSTASDRDASRNPVQQKPLPLGSGARMNARVVFAVAVVALSLWTAGGFLPPLIWATILAVTLWPLYIKFAARLTSGPTRLAAVAFTAIVALILFTPMALAIYQVAEQSGDIANWLKKARESGIEVPDWIARLPVVAEIAQQWWRDNLSDPKAATAWLKTINADDASGLFNTFGGQLMRRLFMLFFSLFALFVLLSNGRSVANRTIETCDRILGHPGEGVVQKIVDSIRGTVNGTVIVAIGEGLLIGVGYLAAGVPNAVMFTIITTAFAMLPFVLGQCSRPPPRRFCPAVAAGSRPQASFSGARPSCLQGITLCGQLWSGARLGSLSSLRSSEFSGGWLRSAYSVCF